MTEYNIPIGSLKEILTHLDKVAHLLECRYHDALITEMHKTARDIYHTLFYADACNLIRRVKNIQRILYSRYHDELTQEIVETAVVLVDYCYELYR